ncbi:MAG: DNA-3-methyladenine glycosylase 2 family protein [Saprospiraceae bacterium]|nr:DNA-3-methyladenine glycosylase 2 family protein [Saprospiraceae bacterium]MBK8827156.1 DNA-3-methyladenine glycosylase 2 family protein [Saprospiraceae bacterium]HQV66978.1 DNA-3-methyladenine glycosylase [Saprospiraceae bacterium]HQV96951.1 DNA-3-methyladenine glycosylase [Saprospiraceae bacterium]
MQSVSESILLHLHQDKILSPIIDKCTLTIHKAPLQLFDDLLRSIVSQQLSTKAAATIYDRFLALFENKMPTPDQIKKQSDAQLRAVGLSGQKSAYIRNVVDHFDANNLYNRNWDNYSDDEIIDELTKIKGVGKWTVEMILMFSLHRPDVLPLDDLIIRNSMISFYNITSEKKQQVLDLTQIAEKWRPYRSYACRYLWASKDLKF